MDIQRSSSNPLIVSADLKPSQKEFEVIGVFNCGVARVGEEIILLLRVAERPVSLHPDTVSAAVYDVNKGEIVLKDFSKGDRNNDFSDSRLIVSRGRTYLTSISHFRVARSRDGEHFDIDDKVTFGAANVYESFGVEDPRVSLIDGGFYISYVGVSRFGITTSLMRTEDFRSFQRLGVIFSPDNKDVVIFPSRIGDKFYCLHRPSSGFSGRDEMWIAESEDLRNWGNHRYLMGTRDGYWDGSKIGAGAVPVRTERGWLEIYHGADRRDIYSLGAVLLDSEKPWKVLGRTDEPVLEPVEDYEKEGFYGDVVFTCGLLCEEGKLRIYYGAGDESVCLATVGVEEVLGGL